MAVMISQDKKDLIVSCKCGCDQGIHFRLEHFDDLDSMMYMSVLSGKFYRDQEMSIFGIIRSKLKRIWAVIRNKDYYYSDMSMSVEDFQVFKEYINMFPTKEMDRSIPDSLCDESVDFKQVSEDKKVPYYDSTSKTWKVVTECGKEEGDAIYIACEFVNDGLYYPFHSEPSWKEEHPNHAHHFASVVSFLLKKPDFFSIAGFEEYYSKQEQELLAKLKMKLHIFNEETIAAMEEAEEMKKNPSCYKSYANPEELIEELLAEDE